MAEVAVKRSVPAVQVCRLPALKTVKKRVIFFEVTIILLYLNLMYSKIHKLQEDLLRHTRSGLGLKIIQNIFMKEEAIS